MKWGRISHLQLRGQPAPCICGSSSDFASFFREAAFHAFPKISNYLIRLALPSSGIWSILLA
jgi:hypothetical protein